MIRGELYAVPTPDVVPTPHLTVDGQAVDILADWQGDVLRPTNSWLWIPSLHAAIAGDLVFDRVHVWLPESTPQTRTAWLSALDRLQARHPRLVVAGHKNSGNSADTPDAMSFTHQYIADFDAARRVSSNANQLVEALKRRYPDVALEGILTRGARAAFPN